MSNDDPDGRLAGMEISIGRRGKVDAGERVRAYQQDSEKPICGIAIAHTPWGDPEIRKIPPLRGKGANTANNQGRHGQCRCVNGSNDAKNPVKAVQAD